MDPLPWYKDGLKFTCSQCGDCCTGAPGFVWVNAEEIAGMAAIVGMTVEAFQKRYVREVGIRKSLTERPNGDCELLDAKTRRCSVYQSRPRQCRTWPFWESNIKTPEAWQQTCEMCPGSGQGKLVQLEDIQKQSAVIRI